MFHESANKNIKNIQGTTGYSNVTSVLRKTMEEVLL